MVGEGVAAITINYLNVGKTPQTMIPSLMEDVKD